MLAYYQKNSDTSSSTSIRTRTICNISLWRAAAGTSASSATTTRASINSAARRSRISSPLKAVPDARVIRLEQNYRSTGNILAAANAVIANNRERKGKTLWTAQSGGDPVTLFEARNEDDEADFVARTIASARRPMRDFAVLYRTNAVGSIDLRSNAAHSVPHFRRHALFDRTEVKRYSGISQRDREPHR